MGDLCEANGQLLSEDGSDYAFLTLDEKNSGNMDQLAYTEHNTTMLRQLEASAKEAKLFAKFLHERGNSFAYLCLEVQIKIYHFSTNKFEINNNMLLL